MPVRLCCGTEHWDSLCPDGTAMCCICFHKIPADDLYVDDEGSRWDICVECHDHEQEVMRLIKEGKWESRVS